MRNVFKLAGVMCCAALIVMACSISGTQPGSGSALSRAVTTDALNKGIQFYQYNYCGTGQTASWRGDCHMQDEVVGGYHDAGDHVKFQLPAAFTAALLCWADYEYGLDVGSVITRFNNYFMQLGTTNFLYQIGDPGADHAYWGPPELQTGTRPSYKTSQGSCVMAGTAAALAAAYVSGNGSSTHLSRAVALFNAAEAVKSDAGYTAANGFYTSNSGFNDELAWAAVWLYLATDDVTYLNKAETYIALCNWDDY
ncbi:MAG TPA: hypothetical protein ENN69_01110, partial [Spirochaetia bacterium]|nr:hypothetical protein [Spirochaetia bacterium]